MPTRFTFGLGQYAARCPNQALPIDSDDHDLATDARNMHGIVMLSRANTASLHSPFDHPKHY